MAALPRLPTLPPSALVRVLHAALHPASSTPAPTGGSASPPPSVELVLEAILSLPIPAPSYRNDLQRGLSVEDATTVLEVMVRYAEKWVEYSYSSKGLEWDVALENGDHAEGKKQRKAEPNPSLEAVSYSVTVA
jgi:hypothetical protein